MIAYADSSVILRFILEGDIAIHQAFEAQRVVVSELVSIETHRTLDRHRMTGALTDEALAEAVSRFRETYECFEVWKLSEKIRDRAEGHFPTILGTLDALHISTAISALAEEPRNALLMYSYDRQMNLCAKALGFIVPLLGG